MQSANKRSMGDMVGFYLDTLEPERRADIGKVMSSRMAGVLGMQVGTARLGGLAFLAGQASLVEAERSAVPGFDKFQKQSIAAAQPPPRVPVNSQVAETAAAFCRPDTDLRVRVGETGRLGFTVVNDSTVRCEKEVDVAVLDRGNPLAAGPKVTLEGRMVIEGVIPEGYKRPQWRLVQVIAHSREARRTRQPRPTAGRDAGALRLREASRCPPRTGPFSRNPAGMRGRILSSTSSIVEGRTLPASLRDCG